MGIYTSANIRYGIVIPEDTDEERKSKSRSRTWTGWR